MCGTCGCKSAESFEATEWVGFCPECNKWRTKDMSVKIDSKINTTGWSIPDKLLGKRLCKKSQRFGNIRQSGDTFTGYGSRPFDDSYCGTPLTKVKSKYKTEGFEAETKLSKTSCCCGADEANPCVCMKAPEPMECSAKAPKCACYKALEKNAESFEAEGILCSDCPMAGRHVVIRKDHTDEDGNLICPFCHSNENFKNLPETTYLLHGGKREDLNAETFEAPMKGAQPRRGRYEVALPLDKTHTSAIRKALKDNYKGFNFSVKMNGNTTVVINLKSGKQEIDDWDSMKNGIIDLAIDTIWDMEKGDEHHVYFDTKDEMGIDVYCFLGAFGNKEYIVKNAEEKESFNQSITTNKIGESLAWNNRIMGMGNQWRNGKYDINSISQEADIIGYTIVHEDYLEKKLDWMEDGVNLGSKDTDIAEINFAGMKIYTGGDGSFPVMGMYENINDYYARTQNKPHPRGNMTMMEFFDREDYEKAKYEEAKWEYEFIEWVRETYQVAPTYFDDGSEMPLYHHVAEKIGQENIPKLLVGARLSLHNPTIPTLKRRDSKSSIWVLKIPDLTHLKTTKYNRNYRGKTEMFLNTETTTLKFFSNLKAIYPKGRFVQGTRNQKYKEFTIDIPSFGEYKWVATEYMLAYDSVSQSESLRREGVKRQKYLKEDKIRQEEKMKALKEKYGAETFEAVVGTLTRCPECDETLSGLYSLDNAYGTQDLVQSCKCGWYEVQTAYGAETFEATVIRQGDAPKGAMAKAMMNKAMMEQANIEAMIQELENKVNLGLINEDELMKSLKKKFGAEYDIEELSKEDLEAYFADLKKDNPKLAKILEFNVKNEEYLPKMLIESSGYDYEILEAWNDSIIDDDKYALFDPCKACEGEGWIMTSYTPATRWDPADGDGEDCGECGGSGKIDPSDYMYYDDKGDIQYEAETFEASSGKRMYCPKCKTNRTWNRGFKKQKLEPGENPNDFVFYVCKKCKYGYDPKTGDGIINWRKYYEAETKISKICPNCEQKGKSKKDATTDYICDFCAQCKRCCETSYGCYDVALCNDCDGSFIGKDIDGCCGSCDNCCECGDY